MNIPNPPGVTGGSTSLEAWLKRLHDAVVANKLLPGRGYKLKRTSAGTIIEVETGGGGSTGNTLPVWL